jgi:hypothetical protein
MPSFPPFLCSKSSQAFQHQPRERKREKERARVVGGVWKGQVRTVCTESYGLALSGSLSGFGSPPIEEKSESLLSLIISFYFKSNYYKII